MDTFDWIDQQIARLYRRHKHLRGQHPRNKRAAWRIRRLEILRHAINHVSVDEDRYAEKQEFISVKFIIYP